MEKENTPHSRQFEHLELWHQTFDAIPDIILVTDNDMRIIMANRMLAEKLGVDRESLIGQYCYKVMHNTRQPPR